MLKVFNYILFRAILPYEVKLGKNVNLWHRGLCLVIHPNITIGDNVNIAHGVTIAGSGKGMSVIGDRVTIASGAQIIPRKGEPYTIGSGAIIGAGSVVVGDVAPGRTVRGQRANS
ncbi:hypothetical protein [uncultured Aeromicrobium sp.]|uniref:hypothetical protein n=1 Tax=uncultured Aeromicrobium sp. TaxID=337820 RepID=UPI0025E748B9|nr:hypothetical protein [uncultured Aeromicrobium sp.]